MLQDGTVVCYHGGIKQVHQEVSTLPSSILLVENGAATRAILVDALTKDGGYAVQAVSSIGRARALLPTHGDAFDVVLLDVELPDGNGRELCASLRRQEFHRPILLLSGQSHEDEIVSGFEAGADDYLVTPFGIGELLARIEAQLRRAAPRAGSNVYRFGKAA